MRSYICLGGLAYVFYMNVNVYKPTRIIDKRQPFVCRKQRDSDVEYAGEFVSRVSYERRTRGDSQHKHDFTETRRTVGATQRGTDGLRATFKHGDRLRRRRERSGVRAARESVAPDPSWATGP